MTHLTANPFDTKAFPSRAESEEEELEDEDPENVLIAFNAKHLNEEIEEIKLYYDSYAKEKMKTLTVALVLCLNVDVDPPDLQKLSPCCRMEAWYDLRNKIPMRALEKVGQNLQKQYERWQPRARYKLCLDPTLDEVKKLCLSLRRNAKEDRVLFHYNGHGVPRPTETSEIWVFNKTYTKYIPLSIYDLQAWMGSPSVYVFDCNNAERTIRLFETFCQLRKDEASSNQNTNTPNTQATDGVTTGGPSHLPNQPTNPNLPTSQTRNGPSPATAQQPQQSAPLGVPVTMETTIILAACRDNEELPMNPEIPADLFTSCLTTPIVMALRWYWLKHKEKFPGHLNEEMLQEIPGAHTNRQSMFGELNWVFTAVTDTIAWSCLPMDLFQRLFRQDLLVASLFRNFLLADRVMRAYGVTPVSHPALPPTFNHPMWAAWDHALDNFLEQLPGLLGQSSNQESEIPPIIPSFSKSRRKSSKHDALPILQHPESENPDQVPLLATLNISPVSAGGHDEVTDSSDASEDPIPVAMVSSRQQQQLQQRTLPKRPAGVTQSNVRRTSGPYLQPLTSQSRHGHHHGHHNNSHQQQLTTLATPANSYRHTTFFYNQLTAFEVWLTTADDLKKPALQLPVLLQVLLSQVHRIRALDLLSQYVDLGSWAVEQSLSVGIFPYMVRLLQSPVPEVKPLLVFIWCKIIASAETEFARNDVVKESGCKYFISTLTEPEKQTPRTRTMAAFVLAKMLDKNAPGQELLLKENFMSVIMDQLDINSPDLHTESFIRLRLWLILCLIKLWHKNDNARWHGVRNNMHEQLYQYLRDVSPEVRAATVCALGTFMDNRASDGSRTDHATQIDHQVANHLIQVSAQDGSPLVRRELVVALCGLVRQFEPQFIAMGYQYMEEMRVKEQEIMNRSPSTIMRTRAAGLRGYASSGLLTSMSGLSTMKLQETVEALSHSYSCGLQRVTSHADFVRYDDNVGLRKTGSSSNFAFFSAQASVPWGNIYAQLWRSLMNLTRDPFPDVANMAKLIVGRVRNKIFEKFDFGAQTMPSNATNTIPRTTGARLTARKDADPHSAPGSPSQSPNRKTGRQSPPRGILTTPVMPHSAQFTTRRPGPPSSQESFKDSEVSLQAEDTGISTLLANEVRTDLFGWCSRYFVQCQLRPVEDRQSALYISRGERLRYQTRLIAKGQRDWASASTVQSSTLQQRFVQRNSHEPVLMRLHPFQPHLVVADRAGISVWDWQEGVRLQYLVCRTASSADYLVKTPSEDQPPKMARVTALELVNTREEYRGLLLAGSDDGSVRIWRNYASDMGQDPEMVTAWIALTDMLQSNRTAGLVTNWCQDYGQLTVSGDVKVVRIWDSVQEARLQDMPTLADSCVTCLHRSDDARFVFAGFGDGTVRLFDVRAPPHHCVICGGQGDSGWIHDIKYKEDTKTVYSVGNHGVMTTWQVQQACPSGDSQLGEHQPPYSPPPLPNSPEVSISPVRGTPGRRRETLVVGGTSFNGVRFTRANQTRPNHLAAPPIHCAELKVDGVPGLSEPLAMMGLGVESREMAVIQADSGRVHASFKFYDGFSRENIGVPTCATFHPIQPIIAMGFNDSMMLALSLKAK